MLLHARRAKLVLASLLRAKLRIIGGSISLQDSCLVPQKDLQHKVRETWVLLACSRLAPMEDKPGGFKLDETLFQYNQFRCSDLKAHEA